MFGLVPLRSVPSEKIRGKGQCHAAIAERLFILLTLGSLFSSRLTVAKLPYLHFSWYSTEYVSNISVRPRVRAFHQSSFPSFHRSSPHLGAAKTWGCRPLPRTDETGPRPSASCPLNTIQQYIGTAHGVTLIAPEKGDTGEGTRVGAGHLIVLRTTLDLPTLEPVPVCQDIF
jgi:hypothetical protein